MDGSDDDILCSDPAEVSISLSEDDVEGVEDVCEA